MANQVKQTLLPLNPGSAVRYASATGVSDNDTVIETEDVSAYDIFMLQSTAGAMDVLACLDGTNYATAPLSLTDLGATDLAPVIVTAANRTYGFRGTFSKVKILQNGATGVANACLICSRK